MSVNIISFAIAASAIMPLRDATGEIQYDEKTLDADGKPTPLSITLHSPGTKEHQKAKHASEERNNTRVLGRMQGKSYKLSAEEKSKERAEFLAACTISFDGFGDGKGSGFELFKRTYSNLEVGHIADDVEKFLGDRGNFKKPLPMISPPTSDLQPG